MTENPYSTPTSGTQSLSATGEDYCENPSTLASIAKPTFLAWERMRVVYIVLLGALTLILAVRSLARFRTLFLIAEGAIVANVCYFAGPIVETYVRWLGYDRKWVRWLLFLSGTTLVAILAFATLGSPFLPDQD